MEIEQAVVLVRDIEGIEAGTHGRLMGLCDDTVMGVQDEGTASLRSGAYLGRTARTDVAPTAEAASDRAGGKLGMPNWHLNHADPWPRPMNEVSKGARPLTSVELLDAAVWWEIGSEEPQPRAAFVDALATIVGRWLLVRSDAPDMDLMTVMCRARGYIERSGAEQTRGMAR
jgi:hypothetical protein